MSNWCIFGILLVHFLCSFGTLLEKKNQHNQRHISGETLWEIWVLVCSGRGGASPNTNADLGFDGGIFSGGGWLLSLETAEPQQSRWPWQQNAAWLRPGGLLPRGEMQCRRIKSFKVGEAAVSNDEAKMLVSERDSILKNPKGSYGTQQQDKANLATRMCQYHGLQSG